MSTQRSRLRPSIIIPHRKDVDFEPPPSLGKSGPGNLSPDLQPRTPPTFPTNEDDDVGKRISCVGKYLLLEQVDTSGSIPIFRSIHRDTHQEFICKVIPIEKYRDILAAYWRISHKHVNQMEEIILGATQAYVFFPKNYGDLHSYVRNKRKLRETEANQLFQQILSAVACCHENGLVLRDLKLRKFVFKDEEKTELMLEGLEDVCVLDDEDNDSLADKHGCPAYVSPEILNMAAYYSGKAADVWSLGVMLYTILIGRYPFHDSEPSALFTKIRRGQYSIPDGISSRAKCLIRSLLRREPSERLTGEQALSHPWFRPNALFVQKHVKGAMRDVDQMVPDVPFTEEDSLFL